MIASNFYNKTKVFLIAETTTSKQNNVIYIIFFSLNLFMFFPFIFDAVQPLFSNEWDGMKNYFTLYQTVNEKLKPGDSFFKFNSYFYPYGEYFYFTDNTPIVSMIIKALPFSFLKTNIIPIFHFYIMIMFTLSNIYLFKLLSLIKTYNILNIIASFTLVYISPQFFRLVMGHMNLSISFFIIFSIYLFINNIYLKKEITLRYSLYILSIFFIAGFTHLYHLIISIYLLFTLTIFYILFKIFKTKKELITFFCLLVITIFSLSNNYINGAKLSFIIFSFYVIIKTTIKRNEFKEVVKKSIKLLWIPLVSLGITYTCYSLIDKFKNTRIPGGAGFNWSFWNIPLEAPFMASENHIIDISNVNQFKQWTDQYSFIGNFVLIIIIIVLISAVLNFCFFKITDVKEVTKKNKLLITILFFSATFSYITAIGIDTYGFNEAIHLKNYLNPFFFLSKISIKFTQIRVLARFNWLFFWLVNISTIIILNSYAKHFKKPIIILSLFIPLLIIDFYSLTIKHPFSLSEKINPIKNNEQYHEDLKFINFNDYQAILPIPIYATGISNNDYTIDPEDNWCTSTLIYNTISNLPLISYKASRSSKDNTINLMSIVSEKPTDEIIKKLKNKDKKILVIESKNEKSYQYSYNKEAVYTKKIDFEMKDFLTRNKEKLNKIKSTDRVNIYEWIIK